MEKGEDATSEDSDRFLMKVELKSKRKGGGGGAGVGAGGGGGGGSQRGFCQISIKV